MDNQFPVLIWNMTVGNPHEPEYWYNKLFESLSKIRDLCEFDQDESPCHHLFYERRLKAIDTICEDWLTPGA